MVWLTKCFKPLKDYTYPFRLIPSLMLTCMYVRSASTVYWYSMLLSLTQYRACYVYMYSTPVRASSSIIMRYIILFPSPKDTEQADVRWSPARLGDLCGGSCGGTGVRCLPQWHPHKIQNGEDLALFLVVFLFLFVPILYIQHKHVHLYNNNYNTHVHMICFNIIINTPCM